MNAKITPCHVTSDEAGLPVPDQRSSPVPEVAEAAGVVDLQRTRAPHRARHRGDFIGEGGRWVAIWSLRLILFAAAAYIVGWVVGKMWVIALPVALAVIVSTVLWPIAGWLYRHHVPAALASMISLLVAFGVFGGLIASIVPSVVDDAPALAEQAEEGILSIQEWISGPPLNIEPEQLNEYVQAVAGVLQESSDRIASGVFVGIGAATSILITLVLSLVLTFFFLKDGLRFLPWFLRSTGGPGAHHVAEVLRRQWKTLAGFIRAQAIVSFVDAFFIWIGLIVMGVPLANALAIITFIAGFVPIVGAFVAGALAVLVALVANGLVNALIVLGIIVAVQQLESNILQPILQSRSMNLHPVVVLLSVTAGARLFGIVGAFLAVPVAAMVAVAVRYVGEVLDEKTADETRHLQGTDDDVGPDDVGPDDVGPDDADEDAESRSSPRS
ncbi:AI-2E family transporter [Hoyosella altamirensis]|uniref:AI-2E family transporter n=1 Tax=Hoyosella altamirensis TaxID=616997 RepID=UPI0007DB33DF|nr:AI-2E family transporter [Hoyosella altamirensis]